MIAQLTVFQCQQDMAQPGLGVPALGNNLALDRLAGLSSPSAPRRHGTAGQSLQTGQMLLQMMSLLLGLMAGGAVGGNALQGLSGGSSSGGELGSMWVAGPAAELAHRVVAKVRPQPRRRAARSTPVRSRTNRGPAAWNPTPCAAWKRLTGTDCRS